MNRYTSALLVTTIFAGCATGRSAPQSVGEAPIDDAGVPNDVPDLARVPDGAIWTHDGSSWCLPRPCQGKLYKCGDCLDNDGDDRIDSEDPDCLGACQNNEAGFSGDIPGQNNAFCKAECYFDHDTGSGNDQCEWDYHCDPLEVAPAMAPEAGCTYSPSTRLGSGLTCGDRLMTQPKACHDTCGPLTPNGCDCFGCCWIPPNEFGEQGVFLGSTDSSGNPTCDVAHVGDPARCKPCTIVPGCFKPCGYCQLCVGKTELPDDCFGPNGELPDGGAPGQCDRNETPCGLTGQAPCPNGFYCVTGCCEPTIG